MRSIFCIFSVIFLSFLFTSLEGKISHHGLFNHRAATEGTYKFTCNPGFILKGRKDFTDQQVEGTKFLGFTCCPESHPDLHYVNENYFCCPAGSGAYCMSNSCNCKSGGALKGGKEPTFTKIS